MPEHTYKQSLLEDLAAITSAVGATTTLQTIMDDAWAERIRSDIEKMPDDQTAGFVCDAGLLFFNFRHRLRGVDWFE